jgi:c-di-GMP-binding flagellar brake protein YcgR
VRAPLTPGTSLKVTLTLDGQRYVFTSTVLRRSRLTLKSGASANAISVRYPQTLAALQRRTHYRARVPDGVCLEVRCTAKAGVRLVKFKALAADISIGGIGLAVPPEGVAFAKRGTLWALAFELPDSSEPLKYLAEVRHIRKESGRPLAAGMQFRIGEEDLEARQGLNALAQYVARLERQELKRLSREK